MRIRKRKRSSTTSQQPRDTIRNQQSSILNFCTPRRRQVKPNQTSLPHTSDKIQNGTRVQNASIFKSPAQITAVISGTARIVSAVPSLGSPPLCAGLGGGRIDFLWVSACFEGVLWCFCMVFHRFQGVGKRFECDFQI